MNVVKHARTDEAWVRLDTEEGVAVLEVRDEGIGMSDAASSDGGGFGLFSIRERLAHLNGTLVVDSQAGHGTAVTVRIPC